MSNPWDNEISDDLDDDLEDDLEDELDDDLEDGELDDDLSLEDGGDEVSGDDEQLSDDELSADYAVSDQGVRARSADRGAAMHEARILGEDSGGSLEKKLSGGSKIVKVIVIFANGRKLHLTP